MSTHVKCMNAVALIFETTFRWSKNLHDLLKKREFNKSQKIYNIKSSTFLNNFSCLPFKFLIKFNPRLLRYFIDISVTYPAWWNMWPHYHVFDWLKHFKQAQCINWPLLRTPRPFHLWWRVHIWQEPIFNFTMI